MSIQSKRQAHKERVARRKAREMTTNVKLGDTFKLEITDVRDGMVYFSNGQSCKSDPDSVKAALLASGHKVEDSEKLVSDRLNDFLSIAVDHAFSTDLRPYFTHVNMRKHLVNLIQPIELDNVGIAEFRDDLKAALEAEYNPGEELTLLTHVVDDVFGEWVMTGKPTA